MILLTMNSFYIYFVIFAAACIKVNDSNIQAETLNLYTKSSDHQEAFKTRLTAGSKLLHRILYGYH